MAKRKTKKSKSFIISSVICIVFAALMLASAFIPFMSSTSTFLGEEKTTYENGMSIFQSIFSDNKDLAEGFEDIFGKSELLNYTRLAGIASVAALALGALAIIVALLALLLKSKLFKNINVILGVLSILVAILAIVAGFMIANKSASFDLGVASTAVSIAFAPFIMLVGGLGITCGSLLKK